jgi:hypothetical protein
MNKKVAILQSNYIPWKGYFDIIANVDEFIIYDEVQFTKRDWRNRNKIKTPQGLQWLTIPVLSKNNFTQKINQTKIDGISWKKKHWNALKLNYKKAKYFNEISELLYDCFHLKTFEKLSELNAALIRIICQYLNINTKISRCPTSTFVEGKNQRLISICKQTGADTYVSGRKAKDYIDQKSFSHSGLQVEWVDYENYPEYEQLWGGFVHEVTILDLLFNCGEKSPYFMKNITISQ